MRHFHILVTALLVSVHAIAVPVHVTIEHSHGISEHGTCGSVQTGLDHEACHAHQHHPAGKGHCATSELFCNCEDRHPDENGTHEHSITDHGFTRTRGEVLPIPLLAVLTPLSALASTQTLLSAVEARSCSPPQGPCLAQPTLRGPPVC